MKTLISPKLTEYIGELISEFKDIESNRKKVLNEFAVQLSRNMMLSEITNIIFVCRSNSRRSHFSQIWSQIACEYYRIENVKTFSGGIKTSSFNPRVIVALERAGLEIFKLDETENPSYAVYYSESKSPIQCFSKVYFHEYNPNSSYLSVVTCDNPEDEWPSMNNAAGSFKLIYPDPQTSDDTDNEDSVYDKLCKQIAVEMFYIFNKIANSRSLIN